MTTTPPTWPPRPPRRLRPAAPILVAQKFADRSWPRGDRVGALFPPSPARRAQRTANRLHLEVAVIGSLTHRWSTPPLGLARQFTLDEIARPRMASAMVRIRATRRQAAATIGNDAPSLVLFGAIGPDDRSTPIASAGFSPRRAIRVSNLLRSHGGFDAEAHAVARLLSQHKAGARCQVVDHANSAALLIVAACGHVEAASPRSSNCTAARSIARPPVGSTQNCCTPFGPLGSTPKIRPMPPRSARARNSRQNSGPPRCARNAL